METQIGYVGLVLLLLTVPTLAYNSSLIDTTKPAAASDYPMMIADGVGESMVGHGWEYSGYLMLFVILIILYIIYMLPKRLLFK
jgi:hypothetical protein